MHFGCTIDPKFPESHSDTAGMTSGPCLDSSRVFKRKTCNLNFIVKNVWKYRDGRMGSPDAVTTGARPVVVYDEVQTTLKVLLTPSSLLMTDSVQEYLQWDFFTNAVRNELRLRKRL